MRQLLAALLLAFGLLFAPGAWAGDIDLNTAGSSELQSLPGIGPAKAAAIIDYRTQHGPFGSVDQLTAVSGIGPATLANVRDLVTVGDGSSATSSDDSSAGSSSAASNSPASNSAASNSAASNSAGGGIDINSASASALEALPGVGPSKAQAIVDDRAANGPFTSCQELTRVQGIGPATVAKLESSCTASAP